MLTTGPASIGTLRELAQFCLDVVRHLSKPESTATQADRATVPWILPPFKAEEANRVAVQALEQTMLYATTQLATSIHHPVGLSGPGNLGDSTAMEIDRSSVFGKTMNTATVDLMRAIRQWKDLAIELNLLAKDVPPKAGPGVKEFFDEVTKSTYTLVQTLDRRLKEVR